MVSTTQSDYESIQVPLVMFGGRYDKVTPIEPNITDIQSWAAIPNDNILIYDTGHQVMLEAEEEMTNALIDFLKTIDMIHT